MAPQTQSMSRAAQKKTQMLFDKKKPKLHQFIDQKVPDDVPDGDKPKSPKNLRQIRLQYGVASEKYQQAVKAAPRINPCRKCVVCSCWFCCQLSVPLQCIVWRTITCCGCCDEYGGFRSGDWCDDDNDKAEFTCNGNIVCRHPCECIE